MPQQQVAGEEEAGERASGSSSGQAAIASMLGEAHQDEQWEPKALATVPVDGDTAYR
jgi:hypothetical protein